MSMVSKKKAALFPTDGECAERNEPRGSNRR